MKVRLWLMVPVLAVFALLAGACGGGEDTSSSGESVSATTTAAAPTESGSDSYSASDADTGSAESTTTGAPATTAAPASGESESSTDDPVEDEASDATHLGDGSLGYVHVEPGEDIQIRSLNAISGDVAFLGLPNERAVRAVTGLSGTTNGGDFGKIKGFLVNVGTGLDDLCSADGGAAAAQMIVADEDVVGVIGTSCSGAAAAASPLISEAGMVMISPSNTSPSLTSDLAGTAGENYYPGYYRTAHNDLFQGAAAAGFALDVLGVTTAAAIHDGDPYTQGLARAFADAFEAGGGTMTAFTAVNKGDSDMVPVLTEVAAGSPEMLFFPIFQPEGDFIVQQVGDVAGMEGITLMAADGLMVSNFMELSESEGLYFSGPDLRYGNNRNQSVIVGSPDAFVSGYVMSYGEKPSAAFWAHAYDATTLLLEAIDAASYVDEDGALVIDRAGVREWLNGVTDYEGMIGTLSCDEFGDCGSQKITVIGHADSGDTEASLANVIYEYSPAGAFQVGPVLPVQEPLTASWRGVTEDSIHIAATTIDFDWLVERGFSPNGWGDQTLVWESVVADLNDRGGINGRQVVLDAVRPYSAIPGMGISADAVCLEVAGDFETFAVLGGFVGPAEISNICIPGQQETILVGGRVNTERLGQVTAPWLENGTAKERRMSMYLTLLDQNGYLDGKKVAIVGATASQEAYDTGVATLNALGVDVVLEAISEITVGDTEAEDAWWEVISERVRTSGADAVVFAGGDRAGFRGLFWAGVDVEYFPYNNESLTSLSNVTPEMVDGAVTLTGLTEQEQLEQDEIQELCIKPFQARHPEIEVGAPDTHEDGVEKWWRSVMSHCNELRLFELIASKAGANLTHDSFREAAASMPQFKLPLQPFASLGPSKFDAGDSFRLSAFADNGTDAGDIVPLTDILDGTP